MKYFGHRLPMEVSLCLGLERFVAMLVKEISDINNANIQWRRAFLVYLLHWITRSMQMQANI